MVNTGLIRSVLAVVVLAAVSSSAAAQSTQTVNTAGFTFTPSNFTIQAGDVVTWVNLGGNAHNVVEVDCPAGSISFWNLGFRSGLPGEVNSYSESFFTPGVYCYICEIHVGFGMNGSFTVLPAPTSIWQDLGSALDGVNGPPLLSGGGPLTGGSSNGMELTNAKGEAICVLFASLTESNTPFKGGTIKTVPEVVSITLVTSYIGSAALPFVFPRMIPPGFEFFCQFAVADDAAVAGVALSNALKGIAQ